MLDLCLLGTGGMMPLPGRRLTALMLRLNGSSLLIDCGEGTQVAIREQGWSFHDIDTILFTHFHGDHISGLPGLLLSMGNSDRIRPLTLIGPKGIEKVVNSLRIIAPELPFEVKTVEINQLEQVFELNGYTITAFKVNHNVVCFGYTVYVKRAGEFSPKKAEENKVPMRLWSRLQKGMEIEDNGIIYTQDMILGPERKGIKVTYCTDTRPAQSISQNAKDSDLFICEGMYGEDELLNKAIEKKHMIFSEAAKLAKKAHVKELWLTHYSPSLVNPGQYMAATKKIFLAAKPGKDLMCKTLDFID
jgi:ribonuclease Z